MGDIQADATLTAVGIEDTFGGRWGVWLLIAEAVKREAQPGAAEGARGG